MGVAHGREDVPKHFRVDRGASVEVRNEDEAQRWRASAGAEHAEGMLGDAESPLQADGASDDRGPTAGVENAERGVDELLPEAGVSRASEPAGASLHCPQASGPTTTQNRSLDAENDGLLVFRVPAAHAIATATLRGVQRLVRANLEHLREIVRGARELGVQRRDADADRDVDSASLAEVVIANAFAQPDRELVRARSRRVREQQRELLAARARDDVAGARGMQQERAELTEHRVARDVPPRVVHALEVVDVDGEQRELAPDARGARQLASQR